MAVAHGLHQPVWRTWLESARQPTDPERRAGLIAALAEVDPSPLRTWIDAEDFTGAVGDSVDRAMYWQPPDDEDVIAATGEVTAALQPIAEAIATAPGAQWWTTDIDLADQRFASLHEPGHPAVEPDRTAAPAKLADWTRRTLADEHRARRERPTDPAAPYGGHWWSTPLDSTLLRTTRALPRAGAVGLLWEEDGFGQDAATVWRTQLQRPPRVYEIHAPTAWTELVRRYPLEVTWGHRHEWYQVTGRAGIWLIPDWEAVSRDWDAVHLSVLGYLATATRALPLDGDNSTMLAGFDPDETFWLTDAVTVTDAYPKRWTKVDGFGTADVEWRQAPGAG